MSILIFLILIITACVLITLFLGARLTAPAQRKIDELPENLEVELIEFNSESGSLIQGWISYGEPDKPGVILAHGLRTDRRYMLSRAEFLCRSGYTVLLYDTQGHGMSPGDRITFGALESLDAAAAVKYLKEILPGFPVGYIGVSMGAASALLGSKPLPVQALVLEAPYSTLREAVENRINIALGFFEDILGMILLLQCKYRTGFGPEELRPIDGIREIKAPLLLIVGEKDRHSTLAQSRKMFDLAPEPKELWIVPDAEHIDFYAEYPNEYENRVFEFFRKYL